MKSAVFAVCLALALVAVACQPSQQQDQGMPSQDNMTAPQENSSGAPAMQEQPSPKVPAEDEVTRTQLQSTLAKQGTLRYQVSYDVTSTLDGKTTSTPMTQYVDGADKVRIDLATQGVSVRTYKVGNDYTSCTQFSGSWMCNKVTYTPTSSDQVRDQVAKDIAKYEVTPLPGRTIAGAQASCYRVRTDDGTVDYCYSTDNVPLYVKVDAQKDGHTTTSELTATSYSTTLAADVFTPPAASAPSQGTAANVPGGYDPSAYQHYGG